MCFPTDRLHLISLLCCLIFCQEKKKHNKREKSTVSDQTAKEGPHDHRRNESLALSFTSSTSVYLNDVETPEWGRRGFIWCKSLHLEVPSDIKNTSYLRVRLRIYESCSYLTWENFKNVLSCSSRSIISIGFISALAQMPENLPAS